ncbi:MAG: T9SS type A sorting domain-containing protein, partial [Ignavibacteria bacterium]|nr:T9SS type A sorting domain-containing protein [Ignavibacteria bacterium]
LWALSDPISPDTKFHIVKSSDGGATWVLANNAPTQPNSNVYGANNSFYHIGNTFWFGVGGASGTTGANIVYRSTTGVDGPWTAYTTTAQFSGALAFSTQTGAGLCGFWQQTNLLNASPDGGLTWSAVNGTFGQVHGVEFLRGLPIAYAATTTGLWRSLDNGQTWVQDQLPPGTAEMEFVKFYSQTVGMVGGQGGILLRFNGDVAGVTVASPNGGENWQGNTTHNITWSSFNLDVVKIEYTTNNGTNWISIVSGISANQGTYSWVVPNTPGTQCKVRITGMNNTSATDMSDAVFTISPAGPTITWACPIIVKDAASPAQQATVTFGFSPDATNGMDAALGELPLPPLPPTGVFDTRFELPITPADYSLKDYRPDSCKSAVWTLKFQASADPVSLNWNSALLPAGSFILRDAVSGGQIVNIDMKSQSACVMPNPAVTVLTITYSLQTNATIILNSGWNLVSVPIAANSMSASSVFSVGNAPVYGYNNNYFRASSLENGKGYFVRTTQVNNVQVSGQAIPLRKIPVSAGWNMIGTYDYAINTATLGSTPSNIIASVFFGYDGGFQQVTSLQGGKGYWVKTSMAGTLDIPSGLEKNIGSTPIAQIDKGWGKIIITDAQNHSTTLYVSTASLKNPALYELPPVPPAGIFDARFGDGSFASTINSSVDLCLNSAAYPVVIRSEGIALQVIDKATNGTAVRAMVASGKSITITDQNISVLSISNGVEVRMFELQQNYPNPFNPSTTIRYSIPEKATVQLVVYNQLGQKVANLVNEEKAAGQYEATWNASNMPSGVYFYELQAGQFKATKKLILMK